ncbi:alpha/beta fold hydrolase [Tsukamurella asaccharolytica]|uniref:Alpha/beta fold hydrolase n=1 Tax=Tsukamurella asaccharolytica TaxID=2592067 RepID=A0A5C5R736_9ACTN|nr:lipase family protein [Tsukamurella asaccharolytica]TWS17961.1 alpha/beta fold hydrolase [Tsukamurella asaccharolytica]
MQRILRASICALLATIAVACGDSSAPTPDKTFASVALGSDQRALGSLVDARPAAHASKSLQNATSSATDITYTTIGPDGAPTAATGGVYVPTGTPPAGGWPVVAFGHGTTGVRPQCAPTLDEGMFQNLPVVLAALKELRAAVVMPDYLGLGSAGRHPYLNARSHGNDVLGAVRAARRIGEPLSDRVFLLGISQGGRATEAAAELAPTAAPELRIVANAMAVPALSLEFAPLIEGGTLNGAQYSILPQLVFGAQASYPDMKTSDVLHGTLLAHADGFTKGCAGSAPKPWIDPSGPPIGPADVRPDGTAASQEGSRRFLQYLSDNQLPQRPNRAIPTLVINGTGDELILPRWTAAAVSRLCAAGVPVEHRERAGGHYDPADLSEVTAWLYERMSNRAPRSTCQDGARPTR